ncbi:MAG TPA: zinc ribbon domain-containing protein [Candidatus Saccharimonadales bacterium]
MTCPKCHQTTEDGAAFCGNCGQSLQPVAAAPLDQAPAQQLQSPIEQVISQTGPDNISAPVAPLAVAGTNGAAAGVPSYAMVKPGQHRGETKALLALLLGIGGIIGALFFIPIGLALGITGLVMGTISRSSSKRGLSTAGLVFSSAAILASLAFWTYAIKHDPRFSQNTTSTKSHGITAPAVAASDVSTPCYSAGFVDKFNVSNNTDSCDMSAFNGTTLDNSTNAYKVYADTSQTVTPQDYATIFKQALDKDVRSSLPGFTIDSEKPGNFAGSLAYIINTSDKVHGVAVVEAAVLHRAGPGENVFVLVHAVNGRAADLTTLEAEWQWK